jgi:hypothetical protein
MIALCKACGLPFVQYDDGKGTPKLYCDKVCRSAAHRTRNLANREKRRQERGQPTTRSGSEVVDILIDALDGRAHEQMK